MDISKILKLDDKDPFILGNKDLGKRNEILFGFIYIWETVIELWIINIEYFL